LESLLNSYKSGHWSIILQYKDKYKVLKSLVIVGQLAFFNRISIDSFSMLTDVNYFININTNTYLFNNLEN